MTPQQKLKEIEDSQYDHALSSIALEEKKWLISRIKVLEETAKSMLVEADSQLGMYVRTYKKAPYDTGIFLKIYVNDSTERINRARKAIEGTEK